MTRVPLVIRGFGNVGQSVMRLIEEHDGYAAEGVRLQIHSVFDRGGGIRVGDNRLDALAAAKNRAGSVTALSSEAAVELHDAFGECGGGILIDTSITDAETGEPGFSAASRALGMGLSIVFASKGPLVARYGELRSLAREHDRELGVSAAVGIPLPVVEVGVAGIRGARLRRARGVLNDTANQILRDLESGSSLDDAIGSARRAGIIEEDERLDIDGWDAAYKLLILSRLFWDEDISLDQIETIGIGALERADLDEARRSNERVRLVATVERRDDGSIELRVAPEKLRAPDPLFELGPGEKGFVFETELMGQVSVKTSKGGPLTTAACVLKDVLNAATRGSGRARAAD